MLLHRREDAEVALNTVVVVVTDVIVNHIDQFFFGDKPLAVVPFPFQNAPKAFHWTVVNTHSYTRHTLRHTCLFELVMEGSIGVLKTPVTMKQRMRLRIGLHSPVEGLENQWVVIPVTHYIGNNTAIKEIKNGAEIDLVHLNALIPFELCYIGKPFLVWLVRMEVAIKEIFSYILRILCLPCAAAVTVLNSGFDAFGPADTEDALVIYMDMLVVPKVVIDASVAFIRVLHMDLLDLLCYLLVLYGSGALFPGCPAKVSRSGNVQQLTGDLNRIVLFSMAFLDGSIQVSLSYL